MKKFLILCVALVFICGCSATVATKTVNCGCDKTCVCCPCCKGGKCTCINNGCKCCDGCTCDKCPGR